MRCGNPLLLWKPQSQLHSDTGSGCVFEQFFCGLSTDIIRPWVKEKAALGQTAPDSVDPILTPYMP